jgi:hypothetical protein
MVDMNPFAIVPLSPRAIVPVSLYRVAAGGTLDGIPNWHSNGPVSAGVCVVDSDVTPTADLWIATLRLCGKVVTAAFILCAIFAVYFFSLTRILFNLGAATVGVHCHLYGVEFDLVCTPVVDLVYIALTSPWFLIFLKCCSSRKFLTMLLLLYIQPVSAMNGAYMQDGALGILPCAIPVVASALGVLASRDCNRNGYRTPGPSSEEWEKYLGPARDLLKTPAKGAPKVARSGNCTPGPSSEEWAAALGPARDLLKTPAKGAPKVAQAGKCTPGPSSDEWEAALGPARDLLKPSTDDECPGLHTSSEDDDDGNYDDPSYKTASKNKKKPPEQPAKRPKQQSGPRAKCCNWAHGAHEKCGPKTKHSVDSDDSDSEEDDGDYMDEEEYCFPKNPQTAGPTKTRMPKPSTRLLSSGRVERKEDISTKAWSVVKCGKEQPTHCMVTDNRTKKSYCVPRSRAKKTMLLMDSDNIADVGNPTQCGCVCTRECCDRMTRMEIVSLRKTVAALPNEVAVTEYLLKNIRRDGGLFVNHERVCRGYYAKLHEVSQGKVMKANRLANMGDTALSGRSSSLSPREAKQSVHATCFWTAWFDEFCQRPNDDIRLFPINQTMKEIYKVHFEPWWAHQGHPRSEKPAYSTWHHARYLPQFEDVQRRAKHFHCRCTVCATLQTQSLNAFASAQSLAAYQQARRHHYTAIKQWRLLEAHLNAQALQAPSDMILLSYDDTEFMTFPNMTNRPLKGQGNTGFRAVPWLLTNHGTRKQEYVYMPYGKWKKGANRILTQIHATLTAIKSDPTNIQHKARRLVLIADNFSENKNNEILAYIADLVHNNWFDSVELLFGEVGHTHNGNDATHKSHNQDVANHIAGDLGHFVHNYQKVWSNPDTRPNASILHAMFDWKAYYARPEVEHQPLSGHTQKTYDNFAVRAFIANRGRNGVVDLKFQMDPATEKGWRGADGTFGSDGFLILPRGTTGVPHVKPPKRITKEDLGYARTIVKDSFVQMLVPFKVDASCQANFIAASTRNVPMTGRVDDAIPNGKWGHLYTTGANPEHQGYVRLVEQIWWPHPVETATIWALPETTKERATSLQYHYSGDEGLIDGRSVAYMRYKGVRAEDAPTYQLDVNVQGRLVHPPKASTKKKKKDNGQWCGESYVMDFTLCKVKEFAVIEVASTKKRGKPSIELYKIKKKDAENKTFMGVMYSSTKTQKTIACLTGQWHAAEDSTEVEILNDNVIDYFNCLVGGKKNAAGTKLPSKAVKAVKERGIYKANDDEAEDHGSDEDEKDANSSDSSSESSDDVPLMQRSKKQRLKNT